jgi:hypothetical protein
MSKFVFAFRTREGRIPSASEEAEWTKWFQQLGGAVTEYGNRVGRSHRLGEVGGLGGYIVVEARSLDAAVELAKGCPGLHHEGGVEVGEVVPSGA